MLDRRFDPGTPALVRNNAPAAVSCGVERRMGTWRICKIITEFQWSERIERVRMSIASPHHAAFPKWQEGRHPHCHFRGLLRLHSRYGPPDRSAAHRRPLSRGSDPCGSPHKPLVSYRINRQLSGWILPPLMIRAFGAHCQSPTSPLVARLQRALPAAQPPRT